MTKTPSVGEHCSFSVGSDRYPCTIVEVRKNGRELVVVQDKYKFLGDDKKEFVHNPDGPRSMFTVRQDGSYRQKGCKYVILIRGGWDAYRDPHF